MLDAFTREEVRRIPALREARFLPVYLRLLEPALTWLAGRGFAAPPRPGRSLCVPLGPFEGRRIFRLAAPRYPASHREGEWQAGD